MLYPVCTANAAGRGLQGFGHPSGAQEEAVGVHREGEGEQDPAEGTGHTHGEGHIIAHLFPGQAQKSELAAKQQEKEKEERRAREELEADLHAGFDRVKFVHGTPGIGLPFAQCTKIDFAPRHFFAVGSPVGFFLGVR